MSAFTPASEVLLRHSDDFEESRILFAGDMQDDLPARFDCAESRAHTQYYHHWQVLSRQMASAHALAWWRSRAILLTAIRSFTTGRRTNRKPSSS